MNWEHLTYIYNLPGGMAGNRLSAEDVTKVADWYGGQGWELASTFGYSQQGQTTAVAFVFRRLKAAGAPVVPTAGGGG